MRIVQVSADSSQYSGSEGIVLARRMAKAAAQNGHESYLLAGTVRDDQPLHSMWHETPEDLGGAQVRFMATQAEKGFSNPDSRDARDASRRALDWFTDLKPDLVHVHSLEGLGVGLLHAAKQAGAIVVLTMHDFWWICQRGVLVDRDLRPCSPVVECGTCQCQSGSRAVLERATTLRAHLRYVDLLIAPSTRALRVLEANGLTKPALTGSVYVDEPGMPGPAPESWVDAKASSSADGAEAPARPVSPGEVRFLFVGGTDPMLGAGVLRTALADLIADTPAGWSMDLYGVLDAQGRPGEELAPLLGDQVRSHGELETNRLPEVFADHDVLVIPSLKRTTSSTLAHAARAAGLAVVCTDTLGPEEAVQHERTGLVIPAADAHALATALRRLANTRQEVAELAGQDHDMPWRTVDDQARSLLSIYEGQVKRGPAVFSKVDDIERLLMRRVLFIIGIRGASQRYRAELPAEALRMLGIDVQVRAYRDPALPKLAERADAIVVYRVPATPHLRALLRKVRAQERVVPILFDVDDIIFDPDLRGQVPGLDHLPGWHQDLWWRGVARYRTTMEQADMFIASTEELARHAHAVTGLPTRRYVNGVGLLLARASDEALLEPRAPGPLRVGYFSGTDTHDADWAFVEPVLIRLMDERPELELHLVGHLKPTSELTADPARARRVRMLPFMHWLKLPTALRQVDVCLAPLTENSQFNEAKSAIKWIEASLVETPIVASPTEPFREMVEHGRTGLLPTTHEEWYESIAQLLDDEVERRRLGTQARREALLRWGPHSQGPVYLENLLAAARHVRTHGPRVQPGPSGWVGIEQNERPSYTESWLDPYNKSLLEPSPVRRVLGRLCRPTR